MDGGQLQITGPIVFEGPLPMSIVFDHPNRPNPAIRANDFARLYVEHTNFTLPQAVPTDVSQPGYYSSTAHRTPSSIPAGTEVDVVYLHFDSVGSQNATIYDGRIHFPTPILGVICDTGTLHATDPVLGLPDVDYPSTQNARGYEWGAEHIELTTDMKTFILHRFHITFPGEQTRILTSPGGTDTSYGFNNQAGGSSGSQSHVVLIGDYEKSVIDLDSDGASDYQWDDASQSYVNRYLALRHLGVANVLFCDGSVRAVGTEDFFDPDASHWCGRGN